MSVPTASLTVADWTGLVAATAGILAVVVVFVGFVSRWLAFRRLVVEAAYEAAHNLQHVAGHYEEHDERFRSWPGLSLTRVRQLIELPFFRWTARAPAMYADIDHMIRNHEYVDRFSFDEHGLAAATRPLEWYVEDVIRFLVHSKKFRGANKLVVKDLGLGWLSRDDPHIRFRWDDAVADRQAERYGSRPDSAIVCWVGSTDPARPSLHKVFSAMEDPPPSGQRPKLAWY